MGDIVDLVGGDHFWHGLVPAFESVGMACGARYASRRAGVKQRDNRCRASHRGRTGGYG
jgi:hypothetical protein